MDPVVSGVVPYPGLEAPHVSTFGRPQPASGQPTSGNRHNAMQPTQSSPTLPAHDPAVMRQWHWYYYDPTQTLHRLPSSSRLYPIQTSSAAMSGPHIPSTSSGTASLPIGTGADPTLESLVAPLKALQSQFTAFQEGLGDVKSDVKDALAQLHALRTAQNKTDKSIAELEGVIGVSTTGARSRGRVRRGRGRGRGGKAGVTTEAPLDTDGTDVPEKTLVQSVALIQSAIEALLARDSRASHSHLPEVTLPASMDLAGQASSSPLVVNPSRRRPTLQSMRLNSATSFTSQSELASPLSSIVVPTTDFVTSPPPAALEKEYADARIQACLPSSASEPSCSLSNAHGHGPGFVPADWSVGPATHGLFASNPIQPTAFTPEYLARFLRDAHLPSAPNTGTESQTPRSDLSSYPSDPATDNSGTQRTDSTLLPTASSSLDISTAPSAGSTSPAMEISSPARISIQTPQLQAPSLINGGADFSMIPQIGPPGHSQVSFTSPLSSPSNTRDTPMSVSGASGSKIVGHPGRPRMDWDSEDARMTSDAESDPVLVTGGVKTAPGPTPTVSAHRRQPSPAEADDGGLRSGLPTPPSETVTDERDHRVVTRSTCRHDSGTEPKLILRPYLAVRLPVIPTPPSLTPEPSVGEDRGMLAGAGVGSSRQGSLGMFSELPTPLTPLLFSPIPAVGGSLGEEGVGDVNGQAAVHKVTEEHTDPPGEAAERVSADAPMNDARPSPRLDQAGVEASSCATDSEVPVIALINGPRSSNEDACRVPRVPDDVDVSKTPRSSLNQPNVEVPEHDPGASDTDPPYSPLNAYGYDIRFSSPWRRPSPPTSSTPSRYATPSESSDARPTQDEDEVWHTLMPGGSGVSTPLSGSASLPMLFSHQPSRASSVHPRSLSPGPLSIDPSVLHNPPLPVHDHEPEWTSPPRISDRSMSPLTSLDETDVVDKDGDRADPDATRCSKMRDAPAPTDTFNLKSCGTSGSSSGYKGRRSEPNRTTSRSRALGAESASVVRAVSEAMVVDGRAGSSSRRVGGPSASLEELALLARWEPLKICLKVPAGMRGMKRKLDMDVREGERERVVDVDGERRRLGDGHGHVNEAAQPGDVPPARIAAVSVPGTRTPTPTVSRLALEYSARDSFGVGGMEHAEVPQCPPGSSLVDTGGEHMTSDLPVSRKRIRKESERGEYARVHRKKRKRGPKATPKSPVSDRVRNGQIVTTVASELEPRSREPVTSSASRLEESDPDARTPTGMRRGKGENRAMKTPLSSPGHAKRSSLPTMHGVKSSPTREDVWNTMFQDGGTWPELRSVFSQWDVQFIQCDNCEKWYHYGCVAIQSGDPRLEPAALFICPTCHTQSARRETLRNLGDTCARPDCPEPQVTADAEHYFVEKLVGRKKIEGYGYMWLAKWEGYPMTQASWIPKENVVGDGTKLFNALVEDAIEEGVDLSLDVVLLQEALDAGWGSEAR